MVCQRTFPRLFQFDFSIFDQTIDELGMMDHLVFSAQLRIVMFKRIEAMRAGGDYFF